MLQRFQGWDRQGGKSCCQVRLQDSGHYSAQQGAAGDG
jgi:hypothetical protein